MWVELHAGVCCRWPCKVYVRVIFVVVKHPVVVGRVAVPTGTGKGGLESHAGGCAVRMRHRDRPGAPGRLSLGAA
jgi:hypothetical protein